MTASRRATVIGSGPNGLTAAVVLARAGVKTTLIEGAASIGGGTRSLELTLPGFIHDVCSAVHPLGAGSPIFNEFPLADHGLQWIEPPVAVAHPLDDGTAASLSRSLDDTCRKLGPDGAAWRRTVAPLVSRWNDLTSEILQPVVHIPASPFLLARFGIFASMPAMMAAKTVFRTEAGRALFAGLAGHSVLPLDMFSSAAIGWVLGAAAHRVGWPIPRGGSQRIANALASYFRSLGGEIVTGTTVRSLDELRGNSAIVCDVTPRQFLKLAGDRLPAGFRRQLEAYRYGPAVFKMDWALSAPIPWTAPECRQASTVHVGGTLEEIAISERAAWDGRICKSPYALVAQSSLFDPTRAPAGKHTAWAYCHIPHGSNEDMTEHLEAQIERFAPGFRQCILARHTFGPAELEQHNPNLVGGDITGGAQDFKQLVLRPTRMYHRTPLKGVYLCSASTPPGAGVHGMCGLHAARIALRELN